MPAIYGMAAEAEVKRLRPLSLMKVPHRRDKGMGTRCKLEKQRIKCSDANGGCQTRWKRLEPEG